MHASNLGESAQKEIRSDGRAAYQDDGTYTSPEMRPGHGANISMRPHQAGGMAALLGGPAAGAVLAMEAFTEPIDERNHERRVAKPRFAVVRRVVALVARKAEMNPGDLPAELLPRAPSTHSGGQENREPSASGALLRAGLVKAAPGDARRR
jgi:hypothetical protein